MKYKNIIYQLDNDAFTPYNMGVVSTEICDYFTSLKKYAQITPDIEIATNLCKNFDENDEVKNVISEEVAPTGYYKKYVHYFILNVQKTTDIAYYPRIAFGNSRHWIDGKLAFIGHCEEGKYATVYTITLQKGYHVFCVEHVFEDIPIVRIDIANRGSNDTNALIKNNFWYEENDFIINYNSASLSDNAPFDFNIIPVDLVNLSYDSKAHVYIKSDVSDEILFEQEISLKEEYSLKLSKIIIKDENKYNQLIIIFQVSNISGMLIEKAVRVFRCSPDPNYIEKLKNKASLLLKNPTIPKLLKNEIHHHINKLQETKNDVLYGKYLKDIIEYPAHADNWIEYPYHPGGHYVYYYSKEDRHYYYYYIVLPEDFDPAKKYPLLLTIRHGHVENIYDFESSSNYSNNFSKRDDVICADIGGRGASLSNYMGDSFIMEEIQHIFKNFSVDRKRVYGVGHCAGNHALLIFAQNHPDLFAGIYLRKANLYKANMQNLYNIPCLYLVSSFAQNDPIWNLRDSIKKKIKGFKYIHVKDIFDEDIDLTRAQYSSAAIDLLMSNKLEEYPQSVHYRTERNRNRKAYFVEIESIKTGKKYAEIHCQWTVNQIKIRTKHCTGFEICIPPQVKRKKFQMIVNGKIFSLYGYQKPKIAYRYSKNKGFYITDTISSDICQYKGTGLLDIYFSPLVIINCIKNDIILDQIAKNFSNPTSNAAYEVIYADYPTKDSMTYKDKTECSLVIVDNNSTTPDTWLIEVRKKLNIQMNENGYYYDGVFVPGEYCIMQIIENPWNKKHSILYLNTNNKELYNRNFFTRKIIIPSYVGGFNPYLNGVALLFTGSKYYTINEWDNTFEEIK